MPHFPSAHFTPDRFPQHTPSLQAEAAACGQEGAAGDDPQWEEPQAQASGHPLAVRIDLEHRFYFIFYFLKFFF